MIRSFSTGFPPSRGVLAALALLAGLACRPATEDATTTAAAPSPATLAFELPATFADLEAGIEADTLRRDIAVLSADDMEGRGPGSEGDRKARAYLVQRMQEIGLEPGGLEGSWEQVFDLVGVDSQMPERWGFRAGGGEVTLARSTDFIAASGVQSDSAALREAELVFVGYGIEAPEYQWNDFKGQDLRGKVLLMLNNDPDWSDDLFGGVTRLYYGRWTYKYESAARQGAVGAIIIHTTPSAGYGWNVVQTSWTGEQFQLPAVEGEPLLQIEAWVTEESARRLLEAAGQSLDDLVERGRSRDFAPVPLGITTSLTLPNRISRTQTANVLGRLPGTDPALRDQFVVWSAHHDHLGVAAEGQDLIYNGALDNASGCAQLLQIAEALHAAPTRRSHLFAFVGAEEQGLLGSAYYAKNPTVPPGRIAANINYDGANIWGRALDVTYVGYGKSDLDGLVEAAAARQGRTVKPDQFPDRGFFYRSDQFNFAKIGVPAVYLDAGTEIRDRPEGWGKEQIEAWEAQHYHQVSDELTDDWNFEGMIEDAQLGLAVGVAVGNSDAMPSWKPGDEFEAARLSALGTQ
ncbi:MAG TPA: M28 family peptidase [Thermoanaerobaculia bacterium]|nr:M28 family peptidase [Thermoanaerobaculia bacterium]